MPEQLVFDRRTAEADSYRGPAEVAVAPFRGPPEQIAPAALMVQLVGQLGVRLRGDGRPLLRMRAWADTGPTLWTLYRIELTVADPGRARSAQQGQAGMASPFPFLIVGAVLLALGLVALAAWQVSNIEWGEVGTALGAGLGIVLLAGLVLFLMSRRS